MERCIGTWRRAAMAAVPAMLVAASALAADADIYILAGQSNMSGRGAVADLTAAERQPVAAITLYGNDGRWRAAAEPLDDATGQVDPISADPRAGVGPGLFFARALHASAPRPIALLPCAKGGTSIGRWKPDPARTTLYGSCLARAQEAGGRIAGMLWYQGESDGEKVPTSAARWTADFTELVAAFRRDLRAPRLPIVFAQIADRPRPQAERFQSWDAIRQQQEDIALPCTRMVRTSDLARNDDDLHLGTAGQRELGRRFAAAMAALRRSGCR